MELALTYASRTHRIRLARQINELMQQKALEQEEHSDEEEEEGEELQMGERFASSNAYDSHRPEVLPGRRGIDVGRNVGTMRRSISRNGGMATTSNGTGSRFTSLKLSSRNSEVK